MPKHRDTEPWERLEGEGVKAYEAFSVYLELGEERSIRAVAKQLNKSTTLIACILQIGPQQLLYIQFVLDDQNVFHLYITRSKCIMEL